MKVRIKTKEAIDNLVIPDIADWRAYKNIYGKVIECKKGHAIHHAFDNISFHCGV